MPPAAVLKKNINIISEYDEMPLKSDAGGESFYNTTHDKRTSWKENGSASEAAEEYN